MRSAKRRAPASNRSSKRRAIVLCGGEKSGGSQRRFYRDLLARADNARHIKPLRKKSALKGTAMKTLRDRMNELGPARRARVDARAAQVFAEEMSLKDLRKARKITQARLAKSLNITQDGVSRIEQRTDLLLSTLRKSIEAMGGHLQMVAQFHGRAPIVLAGFQGTAVQNRRARKRRPTSRSPTTSSLEPG